MRKSVTGSTALLALLVSAHAHAQDPAAAQALFDEGKRLIAAHDFADACPKFEESQKLDPGLGTLFHVADCEEHLGKTATAWAGFLEVASEAKAQGESARETVARDRAAALEPKLARLTIDAGASSRAPGFTLLRDDNPVGAAQWMTAVPVDPGAHVIVARAPSKGTWTLTVNLVAGAKREVTVPLLADSPSADAASASAVSTTTTTAAEADRGSSGTGQRATGVVLGALGLAGLGVGGAFAVDSLLRHNDAQSHCTAAGCDAAGVSFRNEARTAGDVATISFVGGGALLLAGILTYVTAPHSLEAPMNSAQLMFSVGPGGGVVRGVW
jgi:hypothetical protein